jgi:catechol 2,3-dioxygenase-like lactoylglutathione lyase family enzyme
VALTVQVTFDCADPGALAVFWCEALGYRLESPPPGFDSWDAALDAWGVPPEHRNDRSAAVDPDGAGPRLFFQKVPEGKTAKNRVHLDVRAAGAATGDERMAALEAKAESLVALGAERVRRHEPDAEPGSAGFLVLRDPEGNEFCLD